MDTLLSDLFSFPLDEEGLILLQQSIKALQEAHFKINHLKEYVKRRNESRNASLAENTSELLNVSSSNFGCNQRSLNPFEDIYVNSVINSKCCCTHSSQNSVHKAEHNSSISSQNLTSTAEDIVSVNMNQCTMVEPSIIRDPNNELPSISYSDSGPTEVQDDENVDFIETGNEHPTIDLTVCDTSSKNQFKVFFSIKINRIDEADITNVLVNAGFTGFKVNVNNLLKRSIGVITFSLEEDVNKALELTTKLYIYKQPLIIRPFRDENTLKETNNSHGQENKLNNNSFKEIEEHLLINASCGYQMNRKLDCLHESFNDKTNDSENNLSNTDGFSCLSVKSDNDSEKKLNLPLSLESVGKTNDTIETSGEEQSSCSSYKLDKTLGRRELDFVNDAAHEKRIFEITNVSSHRDLKFHEKRLEQRENFPPGRRNHFDYRPFHSPKPIVSHRNMNTISQHRSHSERSNEKIILHQDISNVNTPGKFTDISSKRRHVPMPSSMNLNNSYGYKQRAHPYDFRKYNNTRHRDHLASYYRRSSEDSSKSYSHKRINDFRHRHSK